MNFLRIVFLATTLICIGCKSQKRTTEQVTVTKNDKNGLSYSLQIMANNLSEDMSRFSTKNDELLLLVYDYIEGEVLTKPLLAEYFVLDSLIRLRDFKFERLAKDDKNMLVFLLEVDSEKSVVEIESVVRQDYQILLDAYHAKDWKGIKKILGDDDVLGGKIISLDKSAAQFRFSGIQKMDRYMFLIELSRG